MKTSNFFIFTLFLILISACDRINKTPELMDKVYLELNRELSDIQRIKDAKKKEFDGLVETMAKMEPRSRERRIAIEKYHNLKKEMDKIDQSILYKELRIHSRMEQDRKEYMEARRNNTEWPKPDSFENYKLQRKLASAPKVWDRGTPKKPVEDKKKKEKKEESN